MGKSPTRSGGPSWSGPTFVPAFEKSLSSAQYNKYLASLFYSARNQLLGQEKSSNCVIHSFNHSLTRLLSQFISWTEQKAPVPARPIIEVT